MECMDEPDTTMKDHKENLPEYSIFSLINPSKSDVGKVNKSIPDHIKQNISQNTNVNQSKNSTSVIDWFKAINNKPQCTFLFLISKVSIYQYH